MSPRIPVATRVAVRLAGDPVCVAEVLALLAQLGFLVHATAKIYPTSNKDIVRMYATISPRQVGPRAWLPEHLEEQP